MQQLSYVCTRQVWTWSFFIMNDFTFWAFISFRKLYHFFFLFAAAAAICFFGQAPPLPFWTPHGLEADRLQVLFHKRNTFQSCWQHCLEKHGHLTSGVKDVKLLLVETTCSVSCSSSCVNGRSIIATWPAWSLTNLRPFFASYDARQAFLLWVRIHHHFLGNRENESCCNTSCINHLKQKGHCCRFSGEVSFIYFTLVIQAFSCRSPPFKPYLLLTCSIKAEHCISSGITRHDPWRNICSESILHKTGGIISSRCAILCATIMETFLRVKLLCSKTYCYILYCRNLAGVECNGLCQCLRCARGSVHADDIRVQS